MNANVGEGASVGQPRMIDGPVRANVGEAISLLSPAAERHIDERCDRSCELAAVLCGEP